MKKNIRLILCLFLPCAFSSTQAETVGGRIIEPGKSFEISVHAGTLTDLSGRVDEQSRLVQDFGSSLRDTPESYDFEELGFDDDYSVIGFTLEKQWKYFTLRLKSNMASIDAKNNAVRDFYIGVDEVNFGGQEYEYMYIPEGESYDAEMDLYIAHVSAMWTPWTFGAKTPLEFTPWISLGVYGVLSDFEVSAGEARGITLSENPPREYVIGGKGEGTNGGAIPEIGIGGQLTTWFSDRLSMELTGHLAFAAYDGSTSTIGIDSRNAKELDMTYYNLELGARLVWEINDEVDFFAGASIELIDSEAEVKAESGQSEEEILTKREKFDKDIELEYTIFTFEAGFRF